MIHMFLMLIPRCFLLVQVISTSCSAEILRNNNLAGTVVLKKFSMSLNWSKIGDLHMHLLQVHQFETHLGSMLVCNILLLWEI